MRDLGSVGTRWLGVGLAAILAVITLGLTVTGRLGLYINPESAWFAVSMAVLLLVGAVLSFLLPLGAEADHGHDHEPAGRAFTGPAGRGGRVADASRPHAHEHGPRPPALTIAATITGGVVASGVVLSILALPPASLSAELAMSRDVGAAPLFAGADTVALATTGDTTQFGVGDWASVFASATNPDAFEGDAVTLTGFVTPADPSTGSGTATTSGTGGGFDLSRLVITHCVIDAQSASLPVETSAAAPETGQWVTVTGTVRSTPQGTLEIAATEVQGIDEPADPYEY